MKAGPFYIPVLTVMVGAHLAIKMPQQFKSGLKSCYQIRQLF